MRTVERLEPFDPERFLREFWQRSPCVIAGWLEPEPLPLDELLVTAEEFGLPVRLISGNREQRNWTLRHGPLELADLPEAEHDWTMLVQEMDKAERRVESVMNAFRRFLPDWMLDDIMISHARPGGSVGPHVDAYDVFLLQAAGSRHWQLASEFDAELDDRFEQALLRHWHPQQELRVTPGEMLYLPAGIAHHGVAESECQTWSVGLRTPSGPELMLFLADCLASADHHGPRLSPGRPDTSLPARITADTVQRARALMEGVLQRDDGELESLLGRFLSSWRLWPQEDLPADQETIKQQLAAGATIRLDAGARLAVCNADGLDRLFVNGDAIDCPPALAHRLASSRVLDRDWLDHDRGIEQLIDCGAMPVPES